MQKSEKCKQIRLISFVNGFHFNIFDIYSYLYEYVVVTNSGLYPPIERAPSIY